MKITQFLFLVLFIIMTSCETFLEMEIPDSEPGLVINAVLESSKPVVVLVSASRNILEDTQYEFINDATVTIAEVGGPAYLMDIFESDETGQNYYSTTALDPVPGMSYTIEVSKSGFKTAKSRTQIPQKPNIKSFSFEQVTSKDRPGWVNSNSEVEFTIVFDDPGGENFYEIDLYYDGSREVADEEGNPVEHIYRQFAYIYSANPAYGKSYRSGDGLMINDLLFDQKEAKVNFQAYIPPGVELELRVSLRQITKDAYRYGVTSSLQRSNRGDPLSQPVQVFSNITDGFGILKGQATTYLTTDIFIPE